MTISREEADDLVVEHRGWAESIARNVARSWDMDWQMDGLDGAAMEALIFCSRRFDPERGVPFKGYARKRIHEASTEAARKSKGWKTSSRAKNQAREIAVDLFEVFPELHSGELPGSRDGIRGAIQQLLMGASLLATKQGIDGGAPDDILDYKRMIETIGSLEPVHQEILWEIYWEGNSMRQVAASWETDELNVIREHKVLLAFLSKTLSSQRKTVVPKVRPGLKAFSLKLKKNSPSGKFTQILQME